MWAIVADDVLDTILACLFPCLVLLHLSVAPYTKVEESFNLQATHDILTYGIPGANTTAFIKEHYDHLTFTGPVPRTFVGPVMLAGLSGLFEAFVTGINRQILVRAVLGLFNSFAILSYRNAVLRVFGRETANWYMILQASQFHIIFWASRTLPNFIAFGITVFALRSFLPRLSSAANTDATRIAALEESRAITLLTFLAVTLRSELAILLATHCLLLLLMRRLTIFDVLESGLFGSIGGLLVTIPLDTFMWQSRTPLWPEMNAFLFNVLQGHSVDWGVMPFRFYFTTALPKLLFNPLAWQVLLPMAVFLPALRISSLTVLLPNLTYVVLYSFQPHKEWRFIAYVVPPLTAIAARSAAWIWTRRARTLTYRVLSLALLVSVLGSFAASGVMVILSSQNYPGAVALNALHALADGSQPAIRVHMDAATCMSGVSRFLQMPAPSMEAIEAGERSLWLYDKTDTAETLLSPDFWVHFDYVLAETPEQVIGPWSIVRTVKGYAGMEVLRPGMVARPSSDYEELPLWPFGDGPWEPAMRKASRVWTVFEEAMRTHVTRGWWIAPRMEPRIRILKRTKGPGGSVA